MTKQLIDALVIAPVLFGALVAAIAHKRSKVSVAPPRPSQPTRERLLRLAECFAENGLHPIAHRLYAIADTGTDEQVRSALLSVQQYHDGEGLTIPRRCGW